MPGMPLFTASSLIAGFFFGIVGIYLLRKAKREANPWSPIIGVVMLIYPYMVPDDVLVWVVGIALFGLAWYTR